MTFFILKSSLKSTKLNKIFKRYQKIYTQLTNLHKK
jgi:hypothetical protein